MNVVVQSGISRSAGGLFYAVSSLCKELDAAGVELRVMGAAPSGFSEEDRKVWDPVPVEPYRAIGPLNSAIGLRKKLAHSGADLIHQHGLWLDDQWAALAWQKKTGNPVVISPHGMLDPWALQNSAWKKRIVERLFARESLQRASCLHALCRAEAEAIRSYGLTNPVAILPNGVDLPELMPRSSKTAGQKKLLFLGRIHPKKGLSELLHAWSQVSMDWKLLIAGWDDGGHEPAMKALALELGVGDSVEFVGPIYGAEKEALFHQVDAFVLPSFSEGLPVSILEAWSFRLPVIMTEFCNLPEGFSVGAALCVKPSPASIAQGLIRLSELPSTELRLMGDSGRMLVEQHFAWPRIADEMRQVYEWCRSGKNPPACLEF